MRVALIQMQSGLSVKDNLAQAEHYIKQAVSEQQAELVVLPENFLCMGSKDYGQFSAEFDDAVARLQQLAKTCSVALLLGSIPVPSPADPAKCYSRSSLVDQQGKLVGFYDKVHLFDVQVADEQGSYRESDSFVAGQEACVLPVNQRKLGLSICYDLRFPGLYQHLRKAGADMLAVPSAFTYKTGQAHWLSLLRARAIETQCFVLAANQCGEHPSSSGGNTRKTWGHSVILDPWGETLCMLDHKPGICSAVLDFKKLEQVRLSMPLLAHARF